MTFRFLAVYYLLAVLATGAYNMMTFVSALKQYLQVTFSYFAGVLLGVGVFFLAARIFRLHLILSAYMGLAAGFAVINLILILLCLRAFGRPSRTCFRFLQALRSYPLLFISGCAYTLGFYITSIIYWHFSDMAEPISIFKAAPNYDMALFLAILVNMPSLVIFVVRAETAFYERYVAYLSALNKGSYAQIEKERLAVCSVIRRQLFHLYQTQLLITIMAVLLINVLFPYFSISLQILNMFMVLSMSIYCVLCMYFTVIFLYYFDDQAGACLGPVIFLTVTVVLAAVCCVVGRPWYPMALFGGGMAGWIAAYLRLRSLMKGLNAFLMCK